MNSPEAEILQRSSEVRKCTKKCKKCHAWQRFCLSLTALLTPFGEMPSSLILFSVQCILCIYLYFSLGCDTEFEAHNRNKISFQKQPRMTRTWKKCVAISFDYVSNNGVIRLCSFQWIQKQMFDPVNPFWRIPWLWNRRREEISSNKVWSKPNSLFCRHCCLSFLIFSGHRTRRFLSVCLKTGT